MITGKQLPSVACSSWDDLLRAFDGLHGWIFRGHSSANWPPESTLERRTPPEHNRLHVEGGLVQEFQRRAHNYLEAHQIPQTPGQWLALMQHFGAPTRLVDFTYSPFVAAYFAFEELPPDGCNDCAIVAISPAWCFERFGEIALANGGLFGYDMENIAAGLKAA